MNNEGEYYFLKELTQSHVTRKIRPYSTVCFGFSMIPSTPENCNKVMEKSNSRLIADLKSSENNSVDYYQISLQLKEILEKKISILMNI